MPDNKDLKVAIQTALSAFEEKPLAEASLELLGTLGYRSERRLSLKPNNAKQFQAEFDASGRLNPDAALLSDWKSVDLLIQITDDEIREAIKGAKDMFASKKVDGTDIRSYLFFAVELTGSKYSRTQLANVTREINKLFPMPVMVIFKYNKVVSLAIIAHRISKKDASKDVLEKVTLIKDIRFTGNRAQIEILHDLAITQLMQDYAISNFVDLQHAWEKTLDLNELNKKFYKEIANWYFWAVKTVKFPKDAEKDEATRNATGVIRLITRLIFVWFIKEKGLVPEELFDERWLKDALKFEDPKKSTYYKAILQNLFFATLNTEMGAGRMFRRKNTGGLDPDYLMSNYYRYKHYFKNQDKALEIFEGIPFLNGGLFECLDKEIEKGKVIRVDGFSDRDDNPLTVPDDLFLMEREKEIDLNEVYDTKNKKYKVRGLIHIFNSYKFTIEENTPIEEEIALDPELLGKVFENLLAAYNPETGTTARKQTGSFYTPREIVNYMVDEALIAYLESALKGDDGQRTADDMVNGQSSVVSERLRDLLSYNPNPPAFSDAERSRLIAAIDNVKVLDPAAGSGAFPMGVLHKLVFLLAKLDPNNEGWKKRQLEKVYEIPSTQLREESIQTTEEIFAENHDDYGRKLYLIENCIYGVDIQPIAVQIAKLRFFISLVVDQKTNAKKPNLGVLPLPNLETKFVAANTLIGINEPEIKKDTAISMIDHLIRGKRAELKTLRHLIFSDRNPKEKREHRQQDRQLRAEIADLLKGDWGKETAQQLADWDPYNQNAHADFFDPEWMLGVEGGFDIVIGNPPYVDSRVNDTETKNYWKSHYVSSNFGKTNTYEIFTERGLKLLNNKGNLVFIVPIVLLSIEACKALRELLITKYQIAEIAYGEFSVFEYANVDTIVIALINNKPNDKTAIRVRRFSEGYKSVLLEHALEVKNLTKDNYYKISVKNDAISKKLLLNKECYTNISSIFDFYNGIATGPNKEKYFSFEKLNNNYKPLIMGNNIGHYVINYEGKFINYDRRKLHRPREESIFIAKEKIVMQRIRNLKLKKRLVCALDTNQYYTFNSVNNFLLKENSIYNIRYFLAILNSILMNYLLKQFSLNTNITLSDLDQLPIRVIDFTKKTDKILHDEVVMLVTKILAAKRADPQADTSKEEREIDQLVYQLYGLSEDDVKIVEGKE